MLGIAILGHPAVPGSAIGIHHFDKDSKDRFAGGCGIPLLVLILREIQGGTMKCMEILRKTIGIVMGPVKP